MRFSIFENDGTLGATAPIGRVAITATVRLPTSDAQTAKRYIENALRAGTWEVESVSGNFVALTNLTQIRVVARMYQSLDPATIRSWFTTDIDAAGYPVYAVSVTVLDRFSATDLVGGASTFTPKPPTVSGGALASVNVPISFDDDPAGKGNSGWLDSLKGLDTTTMILLGLAAVLVLKRL